MRLDACFAFDCGDLHADEVDPLKSYKSTDEEFLKFIAVSLNFIMKGFIIGHVQLHPLQFQSVHLRC